MGEYSDYELDYFTTRKYGFSIYGWNDPNHFCHALEPRKRKSNLSNSVTVFVPGTIYWAKIVGPNSAVPNYEKTAKEWTYELEPDDISFLKEHRLLDRLKDKNAVDGRGEYLFLKKPEKNKDGKTNLPIPIFDKDNNEWGTDRLLGNGTRVVAKLKITDWGPGKKKSIWTQAIRVEELVPYEGGGGAFGAYDGSNDAPAKSAAAKAPKAKTKAPVLDELDDDVPF